MFRTFFVSLLVMTPLAAAASAMASEVKTVDLQADQPGPIIASAIDQPADTDEPGFTPEFTIDHDWDIHSTLSQVATTEQLIADAIASDYQFVPLAIESTTQQQDHLVDLGSAADLIADSPQDSDFKLPLSSTGNIAQEADTIPESEEEEIDNDGWDIRVQPTLLLPFRLTGSIDLDPVLINPGGGEGITIGDNTIDIDLDLESFASLDSVFRISGRIEAWKDEKFGLILDGIYSTLGQSTSTVFGPVTVTNPMTGEQVSTPTTTLESDLDYSQSIIDLAASYRFSGSFNSEEQFPSFIIEPIAGVRINILNLDIDFDSNIIEDVDFSNNYAEPMIGARLGLLLSEALSLLFHGDVSGGTSSTNITWNLRAGLSWRFSKLVSMELGYRVYSYDFDTKARGGRNLSVNDLTEQGIGIGFTFYP